MKDKKKNIIIGTIIIFVALLGGLLYLAGSQKNKSKYLVEISGTELKEKIDNKDSFILLVTQTGCSHCEELLPKVIKVINEEKLTIYNLNRANLSDEERNSLDILASISGTPTTMFFKNGEEETTINRLVGSNITESAIKEKFIQMGFINE